MAVSLRKVGIIGVGHVGSHVAYSLAQQGICDELYLCDINKKLVRSHRQDLIDAVCYMPHRIKVYDCDYADLAQCDIIVNSVGKLDAAGSDRLLELQRSVDMVRTFVPVLKEAGFKGIWLSITNPCDIIAHEVWKMADLPKNQVIGTGTGLDSSRLRAVLARETGIDHKSISAYQIGEHGNSQFTAWSSVAFGGKLLSQLEKDNPARFSLDKQAISKETTYAGYVTIEGKGATEFGIASTAARMIHCMFHDEKQIFPASTLVDGHYGEEGLYISLPCILGRDGMEEVIELPFDEEEQKLFHQTCDVMRTNIAKIV